MTIERLYKETVNLPTQKQRDRIMQELCAELNYDDTRYIAALPYEMKLCLIATCRKYKSVTTLAKHICQDRLPLRYVPVYRNRDNVLLINMANRKVCVVPYKEHAVLCSDDIIKLSRYNYEKEYHMLNTPDTYYEYILEALCGGKDNAPAVRVVSSTSLYDALHACVQVLVKDDSTIVRYISYDGYIQDMEIDPNTVSLHVAKQYAPMNDNKYGLDFLCDYPDILYPTIDEYVGHTISEYLEAIPDSIKDITHNLLSRKHTVKFCKYEDEVPTDKSFDYVVVKLPLTTMHNHRSAQIKHVKKNQGVLNRIVAEAVNEVSISRYGIPVSSLTLDTCMITADNVLEYTLSR